MSEPRNSNNSGATVSNPEVLMDVQEANAKYVLPAEQLIPEGYKQTEVGVIPEDWETSHLGEITTLQRGYDLPSRLRKSGPFPIVTSSGVEYWHSEYTVKGPGIVTGRYGTIGEVYWVTDDFWPLNTTLYVKDFHGNDPFFTSYLLRTIDFQTHSGKSGVPGVNRNDLHEIVVGFPPTIAEQEAIAEALSDADALIEALEQLVAKKRQLKLGAMQELLTGKRRLPGFSGEWEMRTLGELASIQRGASPRPIDSPIWFDENSSVGWVRISDVTKSKMYLRETMQRLSKRGIQYSRPVSQGSLIMSICATVGRPIITMLDTCIHDGFVVFDSLRCDQYFLYYILSSIEGDWSRHGQTGSQMNLNTGLINRTEVSVPAIIEEQTAIAQILSDMDAEITELDTKLAKARAVKQGMMQQLLTGKIRLVVNPKPIIDN